jgi:hypothetical protein
MACVDRSPAIDLEGFPFPSNLAMFAFPHGSTVAMQGSCVAAKITSFILSARNEFDKVRIAFFCLLFPDLIFLTF